MEKNGKPQGQDVKTADDQPRFPGQDSAVEQAREALIEHTIKAARAAKAAKLAQERT